jgi:preprotein translocase subunit YajC
MGFFEQNAYLVVLVVSLLIWAGMYFYMYKMDKRIKKMEKEK